MTGNLTILICSFIFIGIITIYLIKKWPDLDIIDLFFIFILLHFGLTPFVRGLYFGKDIVFDFRDKNPLSIALVFGHILIIMVIIRLVSRYFPPYLKNYLNIRYLLQQWGYINKYFLFLLYICLIMFPIISYYYYGVRTYILPDDFERIGATLPYWFTSIRTIYSYIAFGIFLGLFGNLVKSEKRQQFLWAGLTIIFILVVTMYGRRFFFNMVAVGAIFWFIYKKEYIFRLKYLTVGLMLVGAFFLFSNIYQSYRNVLFTVGEVKPNKMENLLTAALNFNSTIRNLQIRAGTWEFNFLVLNHQIDKLGMTTNGSVAWEGIKSAVPRIFWPGKNFCLIDDFLTNYCKFKKADVVIAKNIFGMVQLDFGFYSIIIVPIIILLIFLMMSYLIHMTINSPTFLTMITGFIINYLINIEENGNEIFFMIRNVFLILILFGFYSLARKTYLILMKRSYLSSD
jgi:hypothetical protein